ncbi:MAG TPA: LacI family DNA-binding transcriptional regulator [Intrasporangium sp.]|uniref:LacI family DNA-binding transcriptional regulator n=1 Tax=Intrasporangium sp. TaxID=1925024 RepID=UPI002D7A259B|nr:LacI family DNA-binding transcriptional regulator [Intrasporangium sp.]HET7399577.1 LacI family DNA-binding transcriptional regulator [Intrasporangium sp.]
MSKRATLADVAARAGLSKTAVSLVLNERPGSRLSAEAVQRIRDAARELNYRPNPAARSLRMGKTRTIGFVSDKVTITRFASAMIRGLLDVADEHDHGVLIAETGDHPKQLARALESMIDRQVDGIVFGSVGARLLNLPALPDHVRGVAVNCVGPTSRSVVLPSEHEAGYRMTRLLIEAGHAEGIGIIGNAPQAIATPQISVTIGSRFAGIHEALDEARAAPVAVADIEVWEPWHGYDAAKEVLGSGAPVTALLCLNDRVAFGAYQAAQERGLRIPDDISIASFDDDEIASYLRPGLTTARLDYQGMGRLAAELILLRDDSEGEHLVPMPVQLRESIATPSLDWQDLPTKPGRSAG